MSLLSKKTSVLRELAQKYEMSVSPAERQLAYAMADALDAADEELSMLREQIQSVSEFSQELSSDLGELEEALADEDYGDEEDEADAQEGDFEEEDPEGEEAEEEEEDPDLREWEVDEDDLIEYECPNCGTFLYFTPGAFEMEDGLNCPNCGRRLFKEEVMASHPE